MSITLNGNNRSLYFCIVGILGVCALGSVAGDIILTSLGKVVPESLIMLGSAAIGALVSIARVK